jgi:hypothetical protein
MNFTLDSGCVYLINESPLSVSIDTIRIVRIGHAPFYYPWLTLVLDTSWFGYQAGGNWNKSYKYDGLDGLHFVPESYYPNDKIKINANDSVRIAGGYLEYFFSSVLSKRLSPPWVLIDTVRIDFVCSNGQTDSLVAILQYDTATRTRNSNKAIQYSKKTFNTRTYLLNGKMVNSRTKFNKLIKKSL